MENIQKNNNQKQSTVSLNKRLLIALLVVFVLVIFALAFSQSLRVFIGLENAPYPEGVAVLNTQSLKLVPR
tara:strand:- start:501 stop:713 length:213 start_codon:yes stop_codon:yes gene_type:complete